MTAEAAEQLPVPTVLPTIQKSNKNKSNLFKKFSYLDELVLIKKGFYY